MRKIGVVTTTRAEYGLLSPVIKRLRMLENADFRVELIVSGTHLSHQYGYTVKEIEADSVRIDYKVRIPVKSKNVYDISNNQAETLKEYTRLFLQRKYDAVIILGDRYEVLSVAIAAGNTQTPIIHLCGGDTTEGAIDEWVRHSITKMSYIHFVTNEDSRHRVIQMGENPERVYNYGSPGVDNIIAYSKMSKSEVLQSIGLNDCKYVLCTYHPVTMEKKDIAVLLSNFVEAIKKCEDLVFIVTKSNADLGGELINEYWDNADKRLENLHVYASLGVKKYLSLMKHSEFVMGNSSSGILEAPSFHIPTINIGNRQLGRLKAASIIDCDEDCISILSAIDRARSEEFKRICLDAKNLYGDGHASEKIAQKIYDIIKNEHIDLCKKFYCFCYMEE